QLGHHYLKLGKKGATIIVDPFIFNQYAAVIKDSFTEVGVDIDMEAFNGECSKSEVKRLGQHLNSAHDVIIGIGGGKTLDTAKAVAYEVDLPVIIVPTIASTDAPCSALSVLYTEGGEFDQYLFLKNNPNLVLVDSSLISKAPSRLLVAGMGDALATYFEAKACHLSRKPTIAGGVCSLAALSLAKLCYDTLLRDGLKAKLACDANSVSEALENVIEANTYLSGVGFESGGLAAAHAIHNGFTVLEECHHMYHGEKVAFGTIVQLVLENAPLEEIYEVIDFCQLIGLPTTLAELGLSEVSQDKLMAVANTSCAEGETIHNMPFIVTPEAVYSAILVADQLGK
ncbi:MAG TPA: glycerol dehydrogenase, partial [Firmicutes bacterium]|nr:glycerol dehydrogenase [Bacillota bacterium]